MSSTPLKILFDPASFVNGQTRINGEGSFCNFLNILNIPYKLQRYNAKKDKSGILFINWSFGGERNCGICFSRIKYTLKNIVKTDIKVLLWQPYEAFSYYSPYYYTKWLQNTQILKELGFPPERIFFVTGDLFFKTTPNSIYNSMNVAGVDAFPFVTATRYNKIAKRAISSKGKTKKFLCLNALPRSHRRALYYYADKYNLLVDSIFSWSQEYIPLSVSEQKEYNFDKQKIQEKNYLPTIILEGDEGPNNGYQDLTWYDNTVFSLVTETSVDENLLFLTEKVYKPIMLGHPFVVWGNPGTLEYLRKQGYKTFPELFDESYDHEINKAKRLEKIINLCKNTQIKNWSQETIEKVEHNRQHFNKRWRMNFVQMNQNLVKLLTSNQSHKNFTK